MNKKWTHKVGLNLSLCSVFNGLSYITKLQNQFLYFIFTYLFLNNLKMEARAAVILVATIIGLCNGEDKT